MKNSYKPQNQADDAKTETMTQAEAAHQYRLAQAMEMQLRLEGMAHDPSQVDDAATDTSNGEQWELPIEPRKEVLERLCDESNSEKQSGPNPIS